MQSNMETPIASTKMSNMIQAKIMKNLKQCKIVLNQVVENKTVTPQEEPDHQ